MMLCKRNSWAVALAASAWLAVGCGDDGGDDDLERDAAASTTADAQVDASALDAGNTPQDGSASSTADAALDGAANMVDAGAADAMQNQPDATQNQSDAGNDSGGSPAVTFSSIYTTILKDKCAGCHAPRTNPTRAPSGGLDLSTQALAYAELVTMPNAEGTACGTGNRKRVIPNDAEGSLLVQKLNPNPACGDRMPRGGTPLSAAQIAQISDWIESGAPNN